MRSPRLLAVWPLLTVVCLVPASRADRIDDGSGIFADVRVLGLQDAALRFEMPDGRILVRPAVGCRSLRLESATDPAAALLTEAEWHFDRQDYNASLPLYHRVAAEAVTDWYAAWARMRRVTIRDRLGQFDEAMDEWHRLAQLNSSLAGTVMPERFPPADTEAMKGALHRLDQRIQDCPSDVLREVLKKLRIHLTAGPATRPTKDGSTSDGLSKRQSKKGRKGGSRGAEELRRRMGQAIDEGDWALAERLLRTGQKEAKGREAAAWLLMKSRMLLARAVYDEAGLAAMEVVALYPNRPETAEGLYWAGRSYEGLGRAAKAVRLYNECLASPKADPAIKQAARDRLGAIEKRSGPK